MVYDILDFRGNLVFSGRNWLYTRAYLDFLIQTYDRTFCLVIRPIA